MILSYRSTKCTPCPGRDPGQSDLLCLSNLCIILATQLTFLFPKRRLEFLLRRQGARIMNGEETMEARKAP
jgi:hypothetical protein